jgi:hypothetical protein
MLEEMQRLRKVRLALLLSAQQLLPLPLLAPPVTAAAIAARPHHAEITSTEAIATAPSYHDIVRCGGPELLSSHTPPSVSSAPAAVAGDDWHSGRLRPAQADRAAGTQR